MNKLLSLSVIIAPSDAMGFIPSKDGDIITAVQKESEMTDEVVDQLRKTFDGRNVDSVIRAHILNLKNTGRLKTVPTHFKDFFAILTTPIPKFRIVNQLEINN